MAVLTLGVEDLSKSVDHYEVKFDWGEEVKNLLQYLSGFHLIYIPYAI